MSYTTGKPVPNSNILTYLLTYLCCYVYCFSWQPACSSVWRSDDSFPALPCGSGHVRSRGAATRVSF